MYLPLKNVISNKYLKWYMQLIDRARHRQFVSEYSEKHHVLPRCLGGGNEQNNLVILTAREHFIAHAFLARFTKDGDRAKMLHALHMLMFAKPGNGSRYAPRCSITVAKARERRSRALSAALTGRKNTWTKSIPDHQKQTISYMNATRIWTEKSRKKASDSAKRRYQIPHTWITNGSRNLRVPVTEMHAYEGWRRGKVQRKTRSDKGRSKLKA